MTTSCTLPFVSDDDGDDGDDGDGDGDDGENLMVRKTIDNRQAFMRMITDSGSSSNPV